MVPIAVLLGFLLLGSLLQLVILPRPGVSTCMSAACGLDGRRPNGRTSGREKRPSPEE